MKNLLRISALAGALAVAATHPAPAQSCDALVTCFDYLPKHGYPDPSWQYSHQCCDLENHTTVWYVYIDSGSQWHLVSSTIPP